MTKETRWQVTEDELPQVATEIADKLSAGDILLLEGGLGMGKTTFSRALIRALSQDQTIEVPSPTFTLVQTYDTSKAPIWHFDLYRLQQEEEIYELGWEEALGHAIMLIEWPERLGYLRPKHALTLAFEPITGLSGSRNLILRES